MLLHCFALVSFASARRDKAPGFGHFSATAHYRHSLPPPIPPWYSGASHEYQHGHACPTTEPHPTTLVKHTHTHTCTRPYRQHHASCLALQRMYTLLGRRRTRARSTAATHIPVPSHKQHHHRSLQPYQSCLDSISHNFIYYLAQTSDRGAHSLAPWRWRSCVCVCPA